VVRVITFDEGGVQMTGRTWTAEEQRAMVLEGIKGLKPVAEMCREHQMAQTPYDQWRDRFLEGGQRALLNGCPTTEEAWPRQSETLERLIGQQAVAIERFKKTDELVGRREPWWSGCGRLAARC
jgi:transposase-like protein